MAASVSSPPPRRLGEDRAAATKVLSVFGTRPELIKFFPVLRALAGRPEFECVNVLTSQHTDLVRSLLALWDVRIDHDLDAMRHGQTLGALMARILARLDRVLAAEAPDIVLVQGDTTSALAAALAAWQRQIPVGHIEAGLRSGSLASPFPEEGNRRLVSQLATLHFAPTACNERTLRAEGIADEGIVLTGNPIVDAVTMINAATAPSPGLRALLEGLGGRRLIVLTTHRRESFGGLMRERLRVVREYVEAREDVAVVFPVHPNPAVAAAAAEALGTHARIRLIAPLDYPDFLHLLSASWLILSDSGGVQEEAPSLGKPLLILRETTERAEVLASGVARLVGGGAEHLRRELLEAERPGSWAQRVAPVANPFGRGDSAARIADAIAAWAGRARSHAAAGTPRAPALASA